MNRQEPQSFGDWLIQTRKKRGLSQTELWRATGISKQYLSGLERNMRQPRSNKLMRPSEEKVDRIAQALSVPVAEARLAAGYAPPAKLSETTKGQRAAEYVDALPAERQDDALLFLEMLYQKYAGQDGGKTMAEPASVSRTRKLQEPAGERLKMQKRRA